eukprot:PhF_6_TR34707/c0_g1_i1/m.50505
MQKYNLAEYGIDDGAEGPDDDVSSSDDFEERGDDNDSTNTAMSVNVVFPDIPLDEFSQRFDWLVKYCTSLQDMLKTLTEPTAISRMPFPICAFGTLRCFLNNNHYMGLPLDTKACPHNIDALERDHRRRSPNVITQGTYAYWCPVYVPYTSCEGLRIEYAESTGSKAELFCYTPEQFNLVIAGVDRLENYTFGRKTNLYNRTLMWVHLLPWAMIQEMDHDVTSRRHWHQHPSEMKRIFKVPAWVYSSTRTNAELGNNTSYGEVVIWHDKKDQPEIVGA